MRMQPVSHGSILVRLVCCRCNGTLFAGKPPADQAFADLDGEPFTAYYCVPCARQVLRGMSQ